MTTGWSATKQETARMLFLVEAIKLDFDEGFSLNIHTRANGYPDAPKSPYFVSIRTADNPGEKQGNLTAEDVDLAGRAMVELALEHDLEFDGVVGIPHAGTPLATAFVHCYHPSERNPPLITMQKTGEREDRRISLKSNPIHLGDWDLLVTDDLITKGDTKRDAFAALEEADYRHSHLMVLVDREQGGPEELAKEGVTVHAVFTMTELFNFARREGIFNEEQYSRVMRYANELDAYIEQESMRRSHV